MSHYFRAAAVDYDGTLVCADGPPAAGVLAALGEARARGVKLILVTGRILAELRHVFPAFADWSDIVVAENGAVLVRDGVARALGAPVPFELDRALVERGVAFHRGQVLLGCDAEHELIVFEELRRLGADCQLVRNRAALMVLPAGISKGTGLYEALAELGISHHSTIGIGDAENDLSLLEQCEIGVAVGNAVDSLKRRADVTLGDRNGVGVARLLSGPLVRGELLVEPRRRQVALGLAPDGTAVKLPASLVNVLVAGGSGAGKSYAAGLLAERLIERQYSLCIFDPEGDHVPLGRLRGVYTVGGRGALPAPDELPRLLGHRMGSVVVDLSLAANEHRVPYITAALATLRRERATTGLPHWIFIDEAHGPLREGSAACASFDVSDKGFCLTTYRPESLGREVWRGFDYAILLGGSAGSWPMERATVDYLEAQASWLSPLVDRLGGLEFGQALVARLNGDGEPRVVSLGERWVRHVRHWHKYTQAQLPPHLRFYFRDEGTATGAVAANLAEFHHEIAVCAAGVIAHHGANGDFSRWIHDVIQDVDLAAAVQSFEDRFGANREPEPLRGDVMRLIEARYLD